MEAGLLRLWMTSFGDSEEYVLGFARHMGNEDTPVVRYRDGTAVSALHLLSCGFKLWDEVVPASYIYAAATLPEYRGRGMMSRLIRQSFRTARQQGAVISLVLPASESLYRYYGGFGFCPVFQLAGAVASREDLMTLAADGKGHARGTDRPPYELYQEWMRRFPMAALRSRRMFSFGAAECDMTLLQAPGEPDGYCLSRVEGEQVIVRELLGGDKHIPLCAGSLLRQYPNQSRFHFSLPLDSIPAALSGFSWTSRPYGMARLLDAGEALRMWAKANRQAAFEITVTDPILKDSGSFRVEGECVTPIAGPGMLRVSITTLTRILLAGYDEGTSIGRVGFSRAEMETLFPVRQPYMNMMLD